MPMKPWASMNSRLMTSFPLEKGVTVTTFPVPKYLWPTEPGAIIGLKRIPDIKPPAESLSVPAELVARRISSSGASA
jgi:hypothetical protein